MEKFKRFAKKMKGLDIDPMMSIAYMKNLPDYFRKGDIKDGDWCAVVAVSAREGICMGLVPCKDADEAVTNRLILQRQWEPMSEYVGSAAIRVEKMKSGKGIEVVQVACHVPVYTRMIGPS